VLQGCKGSQPGVDAGPAALRAEPSCATARTSPRGPPKRGYLRHGGVTFAAPAPGGDADAKAEGGPPADPSAAEGAAAAAAAAAEAAAEAEAGAPELRRPPSGHRRLGSRGASFANLAVPAAGGHCAAPAGRDGGATARDRPKGGGPSLAASCGGSFAGRALGGGGGPRIYSSLSELDLGDNPLGLEGARLVAEARGPRAGGRGAARHGAVRRRQGGCEAMGLHVWGGAQCRDSFACMPLSRRPTLTHAAHLSVPARTPRSQLLHPGRTPSQFLERLSLARCAIPDAGGREIAAALRAGNAKLRSLSMPSNSLGALARGKGGACGVAPRPPAEARRPQLSNLRPGLQALNGTPPPYTVALARPTRRSPLPAAAAPAAARQRVGRGPWRGAGGQPHPPGARPVLEPGAPGGGPASAAWRRQGALPQALLCGLVRALC
jgi:hypothetical protein